MLFLAGLSTWRGQARPSAAALAGHSVVAQGSAHLKTIWTTGGEILGWRALEADDIGPALFLNQLYSPQALVQQGRIPIRRATAGDSALPVHSTWGFGVLALRAEQHFNIV